MLAPAILRRRGLDQQGFTLLELLISMSLLVVMMVMAYSVLFTAMSTVPRGEEAADLSARLRMATSVMVRQIRSLVDYPAETEDEEVYPYFIGDAQTMSFITAAPQLGGGEGLGWVTYSTSEGNLAMAERLIFSAGAIGGDFEDEEMEEDLPATLGVDAAEITLLGGLEEGYFEYLQLQDGEGEWLNAWDGMEEQAPPAAIRVVLKGVGLGESYWIQEIPVMTVIYALGNYDSDLDLYWDDDAALELPGESGEF